MGRRYSLENVRKLVGQPEYVLWELQRLLFELQTGDGIAVMERDWDNLLILDACRYDYFAEQNPIDGTLERAISRGGSSWAFMEANFVGQDHHDTVYVTANPHTGKLSDDVFHAVEMLHLERWDEDRETVLPEVVREEAIAAHERYPDKRLVVHFMQPHRPYLGPTGQELREQFDLSGYKRYLAYRDGSEGRDPNAFSARVERGEIPVETLRTGYRETLDIVLEEAAALVEALPGKSVVTADHGEMLGERITRLTRPKFGHSPEYFKNAALFAVPWLVVEADERRTVTSDEPLGIDRGSEAEIQDRLRALGYA